MDSNKYIYKNYSIYIIYKLMVYRSLYKHGKRLYQNRKAIMAGGKTAYNLAKQAYSTALSVKKLINVERKFFDVNATTANTAITSTGSVYAITNIVQGDAYNEREGNSIKLQSNYSVFDVTLAAANVIGDTLRFVIVADMENQSSTPTSSDILEIQDVLSPINHTNGKRFRVITDKVFNLNPDGTQVKRFKIYNKLTSHVKYSGSGATNTREGSLWLMVIANDPTAGANPTTFNWYNRVRFIDN